MLLLLLITLFIISIICYALFRSLHSPSFITATVFTFGAFFAILGNNRWKQPFSVISYLLLVIAVISIIIGEAFGRRIRIRLLPSGSNRDNLVHRNYIDLNIFGILFIFAICIFCLVYYIKEQIILATSFGYIDSAFFRYLRAGLWTGAIENSTYSNICKMIIEISASYFYYYYVRDTVIYNVKKKKRIIFLIPLILYIILQIFSSARAGFIYIIIVVFYYRVLLQSKKVKIKLGKTIKYASVLLVVFYFAFLFLGTLTEKVNNENQLESIYIYTGSSIVAFSQYVDDYLKGIRNLNNETFTGLINIIKSFSGINTDVTSFSLNYITFVNGSRTNIYTAYRSYLNDYGLIGLVLLQFLTGLIFGHWAKNINRSIPSCINLTLYFYYFYRITCCLFTPGLTSTLFTVGGFARIAFAILLYYLFDKTHFIYASSSVNKKQFA